MKPSSWFLGGVAVAGLAGLAFFGVAFFLPGQIFEGKAPGGAGKPLLAEAKKKAEIVRQAREKTAEVAKGLKGLKVSEGEHRVFVSAQLVYLPENAEPVQPLDPQMVTEDGIGVGWKIQHGFDPADPEVKDGDPDVDGFTNLEEFLAKTDPTKKEDSPAKESKLRSRSHNAVPLAVSFPEKSGGLFTLRFQVGAKRREFKGKPGDKFWLMAGSDLLETFLNESEARASQKKTKEGGLHSHLIPLEIIAYEEKIESVQDPRAGGLEVEVDNSVIMFERKDSAPAKIKLIFSTPQRPQALLWDVGQVRFYTPASGGTELGPFQVGEKFLFEGKEFGILEKDGKKIRLRNISDLGKEDFWVPPESPGNAGASAKP